MTFGPDDGGPDSPFEHRSLDLRFDLSASFGWPRVWSEWRRRRQRAASFSPEPLAQLIQEEHVDLLVIDIEEHETMIAGLAIENCPPIAVLNSFFNLSPSTTTPPLHSSLLPGHDVSARTRIGLAWISGWLIAEKDSLYRRLRSDGLSRHELLRTLARTQGVRHALTRWEWLRPFVPKGLPVLQATAVELDLPHASARNVHPIGPLLEPIADSAALDDVLQDAVETSRRGGVPLVICVFGAFMAGEQEFMDRLAAATQLRPDIQFIVADDGQHERWRNATNVVVTPWLPQRQLLDVAAAAIVHSGTGTLHECVASAVPTVVYPFAFNDQPGNATRIAHHGLGVLGDRVNDSAEAIAGRLDEVIAAGPIRDRLSSFAAALARYDDDMVAVRTVEQLLSDP